MASRVGAGKDALWFSHDSNATSDPKVAALILRFGFEGYGRWWRIVELLREQRDYRLEASKRTIICIASLLGIPENDAAMFIDAIASAEIGLLRFDGQFYWSDRLLRDMEKLDGIRQKKSAAGSLGAAKKWHTHTNTMAPPRRSIAKDGTCHENDSPSFLPSGCHDLKDHGTTEEVAASAVPPAPSAAAPLAGAPPSVADVLPSLKTVNPQVNVPAPDEPALAALLATHGVEAVVDAYRMHQRQRPGRALHWFLVDFAKYDAAARKERPPDPLPPPPTPISLEARLAEREAEEAAHPELVAEAERKAAELREKMRRTLDPEAAAAADWDAAAPGGQG